MNKTIILAISAVFAVSMIAITALEVEAKPPSQAICPAENVQHWYTINFRGKQVTPFQHDTKPTLSDFNQNMRLSIDGSEIIPSDGFQIAADRLNDLEYFVDDGGIRQITDTDFEVAALNSASYSTICAKN